MFLDILQSSIAALNGASLPVLAVPLLMMLSWVVVVVMAAPIHHPSRYFLLWRRYCCWSWCSYMGCLCPHRADHTSKIDHQ